MAPRSTSLSLMPFGGSFSVPPFSLTSSCPSGETEFVLACLPVVISMLTTEEGAPSATLLCQACLVPSCCLHSLLHIRHISEQSRRCVLSVLSLPQPALQVWPVPPDCSIALSILDASIANQYLCLAQI